jgi:hypothetical protein
VLIHLVADYGDGDLAFAEVVQQLYYQAPHAQVLSTSVAPFDTLAAGFIVAQLALSPPPQQHSPLAPLAEHISAELPLRRLIFQNVAPRFDDHDPRYDNHGEILVAGRTSDGTCIVGPYSGYSFSFVRPHLKELREVDCQNSGSQFRSRDFFPKAIGKIIRGEDVLGETVGDVPEPPQQTLLYTDGYGNLKTSWIRPPAPVGERVIVQIGETHHPAIVSDGTFSVGHGEMAFAPGSSGWGGDKFYELFLRGGSAASRFGYPSNGTEVEILSL